MKLSENMPVDLQGDKPLVVCQIICHSLGLKMLQILYQYMLVGKNVRNYVRNNVRTYVRMYDSKYAT